MIGLLVLSYLALAFVVVRFVPSTWGKAIAIATLVLIPTGDDIYARVKLKLFCAAHGGTHIYRSVRDVEGFYISGEEPYEGWLKRFGYKFIEGNLSRTEQVRLTLDQNGAVVREKADSFKSRYRLTRIEKDTGAWLELKQVITDIDGHEILGELVDLNYYGGWVERGLGRQSRVGNCGLLDTFGTRSTFVTAVLQPSRIANRDPQ